jgi:hypothetical protein
MSILPVLFNVSLHQYLHRLPFGLDAMSDAFKSLVFAASAKRSA